MSSRSTCDAVVVGGGPAGSAFALELVRNGRSVTILERTLAPHHKVCGEFLSQKTQSALDALGIDVTGLGATAISKFRLVKGERQATTSLPFKAAGLSRFRLDEALLATAERAGVQVVRGARVTEIVPGKGEVLVKTERREWRAAAAALATGKHSLRDLPRPSGPMVGFKLHLEANAAAQALAGIVQLVFFRAGYVGACLVEDQTLSIGWVMEKHLVRAIGADWSAQRSHLARQSSLIGDVLAGARPLIAKPVATAAIPYGFLRTEPIGPDVYPLGDQLAVVPSFTGDGLAIALCSGLSAAHALLDRKPAPIFQREFVGLLKHQFRVAAALGRVLETPATCAVAIAAAQFLPRIASKLVSATRIRGFESLTRRPLLTLLDPTGLLGRPEPPSRRLP